MRQRILLVLGVALLTWGLLSCQKLSDVRPSERSPLPPEPGKLHFALPAEYGDLIGVTAVPDQPFWTQAWFMKPDKSIVVVYVNLNRGEIADQVVTISRM